MSTTSVINTYEFLAGVASFCYTTNLRVQQLPALTPSNTTCKRVLHIHVAFAVAAQVHVAPASVVEAPFSHARGVVLYSSDHACPMVKLPWSLRHDAFHRPLEPESIV